MMMGYFKIFKKFCASNFERKSTIFVENLYRELHPPILLLLLQILSGNLRLKKLLLL